MALSSDRKLDVLGVVLGIVVLLGICLAVYGAIEISQGGGEQTPTANFSVDRINETHVHLQHAGGDTVRGEELALTINGREYVPAGRFPPSVSEGDRALVQVRPGKTLQVWWTGDRATRERLDTLQV